MKSQFNHKILKFIDTERETFSFSRPIKAYLAKLDEVTSNTVSYNFKVPKCVCIKKPNKESFTLETSAALALFDELNTSSFLAHDRQSRPGVSIHLSAEMTNPIFADDDVKFIFKTDKIGKTLGFSTMTIVSKEDGKVLARGKHIKYLPRGFLLDSLLTFVFPLIFSITEWLSTNITFFKKYTPQRVISSIITGSKRQNIDIDVDEPSAVFNSLGVKKSQGDGFKDFIAYEFKVQSHMTNIPGTLHGGAIAMSIEQALRLHINEWNKSSDLKIHSLDLRYLSTVKVKTLQSVKFDIRLFSFTNVFMLLSLLSWNRNEQSYGFKLMIWKRL
jgi:hypothetical protein